MVKTFRYIIGAVAVTAALSLGSCSSDEPAAPDTELHEYTCRMVLTDPEAGRADGVSFVAGDNIYIYFTKDNGTSFRGNAVYQENGEWLLTYSSTAPVQNDNSGTACAAFGPEEAIAESQTYVHSVVLDKALYGTSDAQWSYRNDALELSAHLSPLNIRVRFVSDNKTSVMVKGFQTYDQINLRNMFLGVSEQNFAGSVFAPCLPTEINVDQETSGTAFSSMDYYFSALGNRNYVNAVGDSGEGVCTHPDGSACGASTIMVYNCNEPNWYYTRDLAEIQNIGKGSDLVITVPSQESHEGWKQVPNLIKEGPEVVDLNTVNSSSHYYDLDVTDFSGRAINFGVNKGESYSTLELTMNSVVVFKIGFYNTLSELSYYSVVNTSRYASATLSFYTNSSYNNFNNISFTEFPLYRPRIDK